MPIEVSLENVDRRCGVQVRETIFFGSVQILSFADAVDNVGKILKNYPCIPRSPESCLSLHCYIIQVCFEFIYSATQVNSSGHMHTEFYLKINSNVLSILVHCASLSQIYSIK